MAENNAPSHSQTHSQNAIDAAEVLAEQAKTLLVLLGKGEMDSVEVRSAIFGIQDAIVQIVRSVT